MNVKEFQQEVRSSRSHILGFTCLDLLAALAAIFLLAALALPIMASNRETSRAATCRSNMRTLILAWQMYADDNAGKLVHNHHGGNLAGGGIILSQGVAPWACGWMDWGSRSDNTNSLFLLDPKYAWLGTYLQQDSKIHKCTEDSYLSQQQKNIGWKSRVRSISMNATVGDGNAPTGPWEAIYGQVKTIDQFRFPGPSDVTVFLEEHPDSINDPMIYPPDRGRSVDVPGTLHNNGIVVAFADGAAHLHQWRGSARNYPVRLQDSNGIRAPTTDPDLSWLSYHSARVSSEHY